MKALGEAKSNRIFFKHNIYGAETKTSKRQGCITFLAKYHRTRKKYPKIETYKCQKNDADETGLKEINEAHILLVNMNKLNENMTDQTQNFEKIHQNPKIALNPPDLLLEPNKGREITVENLPNGRNVALKIDDNFEDRSGPQDSKLEWPFMQENGSVSPQDTKETDLEEEGLNENMNEDQVLLEEIGRAHV